MRAGADRLLWPLLTFSTAGVTLEDIQQFSNRMTTYRFEIDSVDVAPLVLRLEGAGLVVHGESFARRSRSRSRTKTATSATPTPISAELA